MHQRPRAAGRCRSRSISVAFLRLIFATLFYALQDATFLQAKKGHLHPHFELQTLKVPVQFQDYNEEIQVSHSGPCPKHTKLLIIALSRPEEFIQRRAVRSSWGADLPRSVRLVFLMGQPNTEATSGVWWQNPSAVGRNREAIVENLDKENRKHGDLVVTGNVDQYGKNVTLKLLSAFRWAVDHCQTAKFVLKIDDDDSVVEVRRLQIWIHHKFAKIADSIPGRLVMFGASFPEGTTPLRDPNHKWHISWYEYPWQGYPLYFNGPTYMFTHEALRASIDQTRRFNLMRLEDVVFTGVLPQAAGVQRIDAREHFHSFDGMEYNTRCTAPGKKGQVPFICSLTISDYRNVVDTYNRLKNFGCPKRSK